MGTELYRFGVKFFAADPEGAGRDPSLLRLLVPIFHTWIQKQAVERHLLIDVHDYSHIHHGPGILLVGHEGNFSMDMADGRPGLFYVRKRPVVDLSDQPVESVLKSALQACRLLEGEPALGGRMRFRTDEWIMVVNDRLQAPNDANTFGRLLPVLSSSLKNVFQGAEFKLSLLGADPKERFAVRVQAS